MSKWQCCVCGNDVPCILHMVNDKEGFRPVCCPVDNTSGIKPEWYPVDEPVTNCNQTEQPTSDCSQLPKLTVDVFDRPDCPEWAMYAAVDEYGMVWLTAKKPNVVMVAGKANGWSTGGDSYTHWSPMMFDSSDWQNSLIERPEKNTLPDWCKVGEWIYYDDNLIGDTYAKVKEVTDKYVMLAGDIGDVMLTLEDVQYADQARLRPFNTDEMRGLVGKVIERHSSAYLVISYAHDESAPTILIEGKYLSADNLMRDFTIDGSPCGVLEHLENGEWVK